MYIDLHCHILPGVDDGAQNIEEAIAMARLAEKDGIIYIVATPHYIGEGLYPTGDVIKTMVENFNRVLQKNNINITLLPGHEAYITPELPHLLMERRINTINDTGYLLMELPMFDIPNYTENVIYELRLMGITPIIAHPERYKGVIENPNMLINYLELGALLQINSGSITGRFGKQVKITAELLIEHNMAHCVASDAHTARTRSPKLKKTYDAVKKRYGNAIAEQLFINYPNKIVNGEEIHPDSYGEIKKSNRCQL